MDVRIISVNSQKRAAQRFNLLSVLAVLFMPLFPLLLVWIAASIVVYSANIYHPSPLVRKYTRHAGYRFYGCAGAILASMIFSGILIKLTGNVQTLLLGIWVFGLLVVVPMGIKSLIDAEKEDWVELHVEQAD
jgi:hypothetical protein